MGACPLMGRQLTGVCPLSPGQVNSVAESLDRIESQANNLTQTNMKQRLLVRPSPLSSVYKTVKYL